MPFDDTNHGHRHEQKSYYTVKFKPDVPIKNENHSTVIEVCCLAHLMDTIAYILLHQGIPVNAGQGVVLIGLEHIESITLTGPLGNEAKECIDNFNRLFATKH